MFSSSSIGANYFCGFKPNSSQGTRLAIANGSLEPYKCKSGDAQLHGKEYF
jgi:hypothetical protein